MAKLLHRRIAQISKKVFPEEACGFVIDGKAIAMRNTADDPKGNFVIAAIDFLKYRPTSIFHSHPTGDHSFSEHDCLVAANMELTSYLYVVDADRLEILSPDGEHQIFNKVLSK